MRSEDTRKRYKWLNIYDYGNAYIFGSDLYQNPLKATSERNFRMSKYIIRNCPAYKNNFCSIRDFYVQGCANCTDCVMKQIVEKCKNYKESCKIEGNCLDERLCSTCFLGGANEIGEWILDDLDIQEVE